MDRFCALSGQPCTAVPHDWLSRKVFPVIKDKQELLKLYQAISVLIVPSIYESFGLVTAEAMACGCAVVANKTGFAFSLKHEEEALLLDEPNSPQLYDAVKTLLQNEPLRSKIARAGYRRVQNLRWDTAVERLEKIYLKWLEELRSKRGIKGERAKMLEAKGVDL